METPRVWVLRVFDGNLRVAEASADWPNADLIVNGWHLRASGNAEELSADILCRGVGGVSLGVAFEVPKEAFASLCFPGAVYAGNRFHMRPLDYPCILRDAEDLGEGVPTTTTLLPGLPRFQLLARDGAAPAVGWSCGGLGAWVAFDERTAWGPTGIEADENSGRVTIWFPGIREGRVYGGGPAWRPSPDRAPEHATGARLNARLRLTETEHAHDWLIGFTGLWCDFWTRDEVVDLPFSAARELVATKHDSRYWNESEGYYMLSDGSWEYGCWQAGWVGGGIQLYGLSLETSSQTRSRVGRMLDFVCGPAQHPSGLFWSVGRNRKFDTDMIGMDWGHDWHLVRRSGDVAYFLARTLRLREALGQEVRPSWRDALRRAIGALSLIFERHGQFGMFVAQDTGEIRSGDTASGAIIPAALAEGSLALGEPEWLRIAELAADQLFELALRQGYTNGGPGEAAQAPDSESAFALLETLVLLAETTGDPRRWAQAEHAAALAATWVMPYDFAFPGESTLGRSGIKSAGSVWANAQNKHSAPGICTLSGQSLLRLYRGTGNPCYLELLKSIARNITQYLSRADRVLFDLAPGGSCERVNTCDWESPDTPIGEGFAVDCWSSISALLTACEVPGVYLDTAQQRAVAFDHVRLRVDWDRRIAALDNPTRSEATVSVLAEPTSPSPEPWSPAIVAMAPTVRIPASSEASIKF